MAPPSISEDLEIGELEKGFTKMLKVPQREPLRLLLINPNSSKIMSDVLRLEFENDAVAPDLELHYFTGPQGSPPSINDEETSEESVQACWPVLVNNGWLLKEHSTGESTGSRKLMLPAFDGYLICCYSDHALVGKIKTFFEQWTEQRRIIQCNAKLEVPGTQNPFNSAANVKSPQVMGILEASIVHSLALLASSATRRCNDSGKSVSSGDAQFGIITTGPAWVSLLTEGVNRVMGTPSTDPATGQPTSGSTRFAGVLSTGYNADEIHCCPQEEIISKMAKVVKEFCYGSANVNTAPAHSVRVLILGCAALSGLRDAIKNDITTSTGSLGGEDKENGIIVLDPVRAGVEVLASLIRSYY